MPKFEVNSDKWNFDTVYIKGEKVASVAFNEVAKTTEITMKEGAIYEAVNSGAPFGFQISNPGIIPVKDSVEEAKKKLGL